MIKRLRGPPKKEKPPSLGQADRQTILLLQ